MRPTCSAPDLIDVEASPDPRLIAFYLPQYHPIPENDRWWGKGFTEWTNVAKAKPLFAGHYQPHLPADLGFYDLRLPEVRQAQAELAAQYGIHGFCYYHYWFNGRRLLERPFSEVLASGQPNFPFCLCWANENWTRMWDGMERQILMEQVYSREDDINHIRWLAAAFRDPRYIRVNGRPLFLIYRASRLPCIEQTLDLWRAEARFLGVGDLYICRVESFGDERTDPWKVGFDAAVEFQPDWVNLGPVIQASRGERILARLGLKDDVTRRHRVHDYATVVNRMLSKPETAYRCFPCVTPSWDNTARRQSGGAAILRDSSPALYESWLRRVIERTQTAPSGEQLVFINAWNEWAEGNHLEPDQKFGRAYLEATLAALKQPAAPGLGRLTTNRGGHLFDTVRVGGDC